MPAVLIYTDTQKATTEKANLSAVLPFLQAAYDAIVALELTASLADLESLFCSISFNPQGTDYLERLAENFVKNKLIEKAGNPDFNGVPISLSKLAELIDVPDLSDLVTPLKSYSLFRPHGFGIRFNLLDLDEDVISKKGTANASLDTEYTYYSKNNYGETLATKLFAVCEELNELETLDSNALLLKNGGRKQEPIFRGIEFWNGVWRPSLQFIREREAQKPNA